MSDPQQKYGIYVPHLKTFMYLNGTKQDFEAMLRQLGSAKAQDQQNQCQHFNDFDHVVEEVSKNSFSKMSEELLEYDF